MSENPLNARVSLGQPAGVWKRMVFLLAFSRAPEKKKDFPFFCCGATQSRTVPKTQPLQVAFSRLERVDSRPQKEGILEKKIAGKGGVDRAKKKGKKDAQKKDGILIGSSKGTQEKIT